jgi:hypothetical protein
MLRYVVFARDVPQFEDEMQPGVFDVAPDRLVLGHKGYLTGCGRKNAR